MSRFIKSKGILALYVCLITSLSLSSIAAAVTAQTTIEDKTRYQVFSRFDVEGTLVVPVVIVEETNFSTGERKRTEYQFKEQGFTPKLKTRAINEEDDGDYFGRSPIYRTSKGLFAYFKYDKYSPYYVKKVERPKESIFFEFDVNNKTMRKIVEIDESIETLDCKIFPSLNAYGIYKSTGTYVSGTYYDLDSGKKIVTTPDLIQLFEGYKTRDSNPVFNVSPSYGAPLFTDYGKENEADAVYEVSRSGSIRKLSALKDGKSNSKWKVPMKDGYIELKWPFDEKRQKYTNDKTTVTYHTAQRSTILFNDYGSVNAYLSPNQQFLALSQITANNKSVIYVFSLKTKKRLVSVPAPYKLSISNIDWLSNDLIRIIFDASRPDDYPPFYLNLQSGPLIKGERLYDLERDYYYDDFDYQNLLTLTAPKLVKFNGTPILYRGQGTFKYGESYYIALKELSEQTGTIIESSSPDVVVRYNGKRAEISKKDLLISNGTTYVPLGTFSRKLGWQINVLRAGYPDEMIEITS